MCTSLLIPSSFPLHPLAWSTRTYNQDCGALRAAHAGIALSDAEASIVSPFTGKSKSVRNVVDLLLEGRATLHTSFAMYKFLIGNGLVLSLTKQVILYYGILLCIFGYIVIVCISDLEFPQWRRDVKGIDQKEPSLKRCSHYFGCLFLYRIRLLHWVWVTL